MLKTEFRVSYVHVYYFSIYFFRTLRNSKKLSRIAVNHVLNRMLNYC
jgi:hypothetical protein